MATRGTVWDTLLDAPKTRILVQGEENAPGQGSLGKSTGSGGLRVSSWRKPSRAGGPGWSRGH